MDSFDGPLVDPNDDVTAVVGGLAGTVASWGSGGLAVSAEFDVEPSPVGNYQETSTLAAGIVLSSPGSWRLAASVLRTEADRSTGPDLERTTSALDVSWEASEGWRVCLVLQHVEHESDADAEDRAATTVSVAVRWGAELRSTCWWMAWSCPCRRTRTYFIRCRVPS